MAMVVIYTFGVVESYVVKRTETPGLSGHVAASVNSGIHTHFVSYLTPIITGCEYHD